MNAGTKLYHQTDLPTAKIILETQEMKPGSRGGIYFATTPELTGHKAHKKGVILEVTVDLGRIHTLDANGDPSMTRQKLQFEGFDSVCIARAVSSGQEYVVYDPRQVLSIEWMREDSRWGCLAAAAAAARAVAAAMEAVARAMAAVARAVAAPMEAVVRVAAAVAARAFTRASAAGVAAADSGYTRVERMDDGSWC